MTTALTQCLVHFPLHTRAMLHRRTSNSTSRLVRRHTMAAISAPTCTIQMHNINNNNNSNSHISMPTRSTQTRPLETITRTIRIPSTPKVTLTNSSTLLMTSITKDRGMEKFMADKARKKWLSSQQAPGLQASKTNLPCGLP